MRNKLLIVIAVLYLAIYLVPHANPESQDTFPFVMGKRYYSPANIPMPPRGVPIKDPNFHTTITRITDQTADRYKGPGIQNEYAKSDPENSDGTLLVLRSNTAAWYLYSRSTFRVLKELAVFNPCNQEPEPRWDHLQPYVFYYVCNTQLKSYNTTTGTSRTIHNFKKEFPSAEFITTKTEGDTSIDRRYWCFMVQDPDYNLLSVIVYDKERDKILGQKSSGFLDKINWVGMDMSGNHCILGYESLTYPHVFSRDFSDGATLPDGSNGHGDFALTADGKDVLVYQNVRTDYIAMTDLNSGIETKLVHIPFEVNTDIGLHFSGNCSRTPGWVLVSTYGSKNPPAGKRHSWMDTQLFLVELKKQPRIWRIAHTQAYTSLEPDGEKNYFAEAFAAINKKGTRVYWGANWGKLTMDYSETYQVTLPPNWPNLMP